MITSDLFLRGPLPGPQVCIKNTPQRSVEGLLRASNLNFWIRKQTFSSVLGLIKHNAGEKFWIIFNHSNCAVSGNTHVNSRIRTFFHPWTSVVETVGPLGNIWWLKIVIFWCVPNPLSSWKITFTRRPAAILVIFIHFFSSINIVLTNQTDTSGQQTF